PSCTGSLAPAPICYKTREKFDIYNWKRQKRISLPDKPRLRQLGTGGVARSARGVFVLSSRQRYQRITVPLRLFGAAKSILRSRYAALYAAAIARRVKLPVSAGYFSDKREIPIVKCSGGKLLSQRVRFIRSTFDWAVCSEPLARSRRSPCRRNSS